MEFHDDELKHFDEHGAVCALQPNESNHIDNDGARIYFEIYGAGKPVVLLHGGLGHSGNWAHQIQPLCEAGRRVILIDSRGHGRSTRDSRPFTYELMASDVLAVMDFIGLATAPLIGWSDGACIALILAMQVAARVERVFFFACNMDPSGAREPGPPGPVVQRCFSRHRKDYARLSATPTEFATFVADITTMMQTQPNYGARELGAIEVPVVIALSESDEFIRPEHAAYLARTIPRAKYLELRGVSHFAPLQRPRLFSERLLAFLNGQQIEARQA